jgi:formate hydrogenlyase subunit 4
MWAFDSTHQLILLTGREGSCPTIEETHAQIAQYMTTVLLTLVIMIIFEPSLGKLQIHSASSFYNIYLYFKCYSGAPPADL